MMFLSITSGNDIDDIVNIVTISRRHWVDIDTISKISSISTSILQYFGNQACLKGWRIWDVHVEPSIHQQQSWFPEMWSMVIWPNMHILSGGFATTEQGCQCCTYCLRHGLYIRENLRFFNTGMEFSKNLYAESQLTTRPFLLWAPLLTRNASEQI